MGLTVGGMGRGQDEQGFNEPDGGNVGIRMVQGSEEGQRRIGRNGNGISIDVIYWDSPEFFGIPSGSL